MGDPLAAQVESAVQNVRSDAPRDSPPLFDAASERVELADVDLIVRRHQRSGNEEGYRRGLRDGYSQGRFDLQVAYTRRLTAAATVIADYLGATVEQLLHEVLVERAEDGKRDRRTRQEIREEAAGVLMRVREAQVLLQDLAVAMERER